MRKLETMMSKHLRSKAAGGYILAMLAMFWHVGVGRLARYRRLTLSAVAVVFGAALVIAPVAPEAQAACANPVACENQLPGTPQTVWDIDRSDGKTIQGFADPFSVN